MTLDQAHIAELCKQFLHLWTALPLNYDIMLQIQLR